MSTNYFIEAYADHKYLKEKGYPEKAALKLVGDRHRLTRIERNSLFRGVIAEALAEPRRRKTVRGADVAGAALGIDWYNVLITTESYLRGVPVFVSEDGIVRDSSATHGSYRRSGITTRAFQELIVTLKALEPAQVDVFLDSPIPFSGLMAEEIRQGLEELPCPSLVSLAHSADFHLKTYDGIVASSDSVILDSALRVLDLPRCVLEGSFAFTPPMIRDLFPFSPAQPLR